MFTNIMLQNLLHLRTVSKIRPRLTKQCLASLTTQSFYNNVFNAILLKESESTLYEVDYDYTATHHTIMELLDCGPGDAIQLIEADPDLLRLPAANLIEINTLCRQNKIPHNILSKNLAWVCRTKPEELKHRFLYYWKWSFSNENERPEILPLLSLSLSKLTTLTCRTMSEWNKIPQHNRISYFSHKLDSSVLECTDLIIKYPFLMTRSLDIVFQVIDSLLEAGLDPKDIYKDPWAIQYSPEFIQDKLDLFQSKNIQHIKPWMLRCKDSTLARCLEIRSLAQQVSLQFTSKDQYLSDRLGIDPSDMLEFKTKYPRVAQISLGKLKTMLDLLLVRAECEPRDIYCHAEVLTFSPENIEYRLEALKLRGVSHIPLKYLCLRNKKFKLYLKQFDQKKK